MANIFLSLDGKTGEPVMGEKRKKIYCRVNAEEINEDGKEYIKVNCNGVPNYTPRIYNKNGKSIEIKGIWEQELRKASDEEDGNPNYIGEHDHIFYIPKVPSGKNWKWSKKNELPLDAIGVAVNGCLLYNSFTAGRNTYAVESELFDTCCGHPDSNKQYHYHQHPICATGNSSLTNIPQNKVSDYINQLVKDNSVSPVIGYMFDGVPVTGPVSYNKDGNVRILQPSYDDDVYVEGKGDLDYYNGINSPIIENGESVYHYVSTIKSSDGISVDLSSDNNIIPLFPYLIKAYKYEPDTRNLKE
tara:strand:- start:2438 stop:3340 length:903 start_codon:yes stop_codon:yes gene_type:complete